MAFPVKPEAALASRFRNILQDMQPIFDSKDMLWFWEIDGDLKTLEKRLKRIQDVLNDAEGRSQIEGSVSDWMDDLRELLYCIEDFVDGMNIECVRIEKQLAAKNQAAYTAQNQLAVLNQAIRSPEYASQKQLEAQNYHSLDHQAARIYTVFDITADCNPQKKTISDSISNIIGKLMEVEKNAKELNLKPQTLAGTPVTSFAVKDGDDTGPLVEKSDIYGREEDTDHVIKLLMNHNDSSRNYSVISMVGMGGVGKTTLARLVFMDERVKSHFDMQSWACVSDDSNLTRVVKELIESISKKKPSTETNQALLESLKVMVTAKKVLFVLDDMWTVEAWEKLKVAFTHCAEGSKILVTTRNKSIGYAINDKEIYELQTLEYKYCWDLFKEKAFGRVVDERLERIGTKIVKKCKGVPLAVKVIGSSLRSVPEEMWESILNNEIWESMNVAKDRIFPVLKLSYHYLPSSLKRCFQYFAVFPTDYWFERDNLIRLWIAEGLIESREGGMLEDIGCSYYIELQRRCIIQEDGRVHDLLHSLACLVSGKFFSRSAKGIKSYTHMRSIRHLSLIDKEVNIEMLDEATNLCTLLVRGEHLLDMNKLKWTLLRVLDLSGNDLSELPSSVGNLKHLRYFDLSWNRELQSLPDSICELHNLQTLDLSDCNGMRGSALPTHMGNLQNLRFLGLSEMKYLSALPNSIVKLSNLLTLDLKGCENLTCMPDNIGGLQSLQRLWLNGCHSISHLPSEIGNLQRLRELLLRWSSISCLPESICNIRNLQVLDISGCESLNSLPGNIGNLQHLRELLLRDSSISCLPESICNIRNLQVLDISGCKSLNSLPRNIGNRQHLRELLLRDSSISCLPESICNIRNLQVLDISQCKSLNSLPRNIGNLTCIQKLDRFVVGTEEGHGIEELRDMNKLQGELVISCLANLQSVEHALMANLKKKVLDEIHFEWGNEGHESHDSINDLEDVSNVVDRDLETRVLDALEPHPTSLKSLSFLNYRGGRIPKWLSALSFLVLKKLFMKGLEGINRMVDLELPSLERLEIESCLQLKDVSMGVPNLIELVVVDCRDLTTLSISPSLGNSSSSLASSILDLPQLKELTFRGCSSLRDICMVLVPGLEKLWINDFKGLNGRIPKWLSALSPVLKKLFMKGLEGINRMVDLELPSLERLEIESCLQLKDVSMGVPNLIELVVVDCRDLTTLSISPSLGNSSSSLASSILDLPQLKELTFRGCSSLRDICMVLVPGLENLWINDCKGLKIYADHMTNLRTLLLTSLPNLTLLGGFYLGSSSSLTSLKELPISSGCVHELISLAMPFDCEAHGSDDLLLPVEGGGMFPNLVVLYVRECPKLKFSPEELLHFTSLKYFTFSGDQLESLKVASLQNLPCLRSMDMTDIAGELVPLVGDDEAGSTSSSLPTLTRLGIHKCPNLTLLPKALLTIASLRELSIGNCPELVSFPETGLPPLLQELYVHSCKNLQYFPTGLNDHTSLRSIYFFYCEQVEARPDEGPPPNLSHLTVVKCPKLEQQIKQHRKDWLPKTRFY